MTGFDADAIRREFAAIRGARGNWIGFTEAGDAGLDLSWRQALLAPGSYYDGAVLITKGVYDRFIDAVMGICGHGVPVEVHAGCTGWGGTAVEPNVMPVERQLAQVRKLLDRGFPAERLTLRIDPIFPTEAGIARATSVVDAAYKEGILPGCRVRFSVFDQYPHVAERFHRAGLPPVYPDGAKYAPDYAFRQLAEALGRYPLAFESCAEPGMPDRCGKATFPRTGCLSHTDFVRMGLVGDERPGSNNQRRDGCLCNAAKHEMLHNRRPCAHGCLYCYWRDR